jgi:hypothetical protein
MNDSRGYGMPPSDYLFLSLASRSYYIDCEWRIFHACFQSLIIRIVPEVNGDSSEDVLFHARAINEAKKMARNLLNGEEVPISKR